MQAAPAESGGPVPGYDFFARARDKLSFSLSPSLFDPDAVPPLGDHQFDAAIRAMADVRPIRPAAVLIPVVDHPEPTVLLTLRSSRLSNHAGQVAFPGGRIDAADESPLAAALREAEEEIGLDRALVEPLGYLDLYLSGTGFRIVPTVARVAPRFTVKPNPAEVEEIFEVPLAFAMGPENYQRHSREWRGMMRSYYAMPFGERYIWGVTAGILRNLYERLYGTAPPGPTPVSAA